MVSFIFLFVSVLWILIVSLSSVLVPVEGVVLIILIIAAVWVVRLFIDPLIIRCVFILLLFVLEDLVLLLGRRIMSFDPCSESQPSWELASSDCDDVVVKSSQHSEFGVDSSFWWVPAPVLVLVSLGYEDIASIDPGDLNPHPITGTHARWVSDNPTAHILIQE